MSEYRIQHISGHEAAPYLRELQISDADADSPKSLVLIAFYEEKVIGASVGISLEYAEVAISDLFSKQGYDPVRVFYFRDSLVLKDFRRQGIGIRLFEEQERYARKIGQFDYTTFCAEESPEKDRFWQKRGYIKKTDIRIRDNGVFRIKSLAWSDVR